MLFKDPEEIILEVLTPQQALNKWDIQREIEKTSGMKTQNLAQGFGEIMS